MDIGHLTTLRISTNCAVWDLVRKSIASKGAEKMNLSKVSADFAARQGHPTQGFVRL